MKSGTVTYATLFPAARRAILPQRRSVSPLLGHGGGASDLPAPVCWINSRIEIGTGLVWVVYRPLFRTMIDLVPPIITTR
jgi:hypothetical protein